MRQRDLRQQFKMEWAEYAIATSLINTEFMLTTCQVAEHSSVSHIEKENMKVIPTGENVTYLFFYIVYLLTLLIAGTV